MKHHYKDITDRIDSPPLWWDENGVPRYCKFDPSECANIYAQQVVFMVIGCQGCGTEFQVCMSSDPFDTSLQSLMQDHRLHYGDPPNYGCCDAGPTMNSEPLKVLEFWKRQGALWTRYAELEVDFQ